MKLTIKLFFCINSKYVPKYDAVRKNDLINLQNFLNNSKHLLIITGAGISTESGIPDYRSKDVGLYARTNHKPIFHNEFMSSKFARMRYWARNFVGWPQFSNREPNAAHFALASWQLNKKLTLVTQNVDGLHTKAGSTNVLELHGSMHQVICMGCNTSMPRHELQNIFNDMNSDWLKELIVETNTTAPDGDVLINNVSGFKVPACKHCGGILKPNVVFFGANVSSLVVNRVRDVLEECDSVLVCGSSLDVYSGFRFVSQANELRKWIAILNIGSTRADPIADLKISGPCGLILPRMII